MAPNDEFPPETIDEQIEHLSRVPSQRTHPADHDDASLVQALRRIYRVPLSEADRTSLERARQRIVDGRTSDKTLDHENTLQGQRGVSGSLQRNAEQRKRSIIVRVLSSLAAVIIVGALVGSWALVTHLAVHHQTTQTSTVPAPRSSPSPSAPAPCQTQHLLLAFDKGGVALGNAAAQFFFANQSKGSCTLVGYPALQLLDARHQPIRAQVMQSPVGYLYVTHAPHRFVLQAGGKAYFVVEWSATGDCATSTAFLRVRPPGNQTPLLIAFRFCPDKESVEISPLEPNKVLGVFV